MKSKGNLYILITAFLWSLGGLLVKVIPINPIAINGLRSIIALIFYFIYERSCKIKLNKYVVIAALCLVCTNNLYVIANKMTTAANVIVLQYAAPIYVLLLESFYHKKYPSKQKVFVIALAFVGMIFFFLDKMDAGALLGNILAILAGVSFAGVFFVNSLEEASSPDASKLAFIISFVVALPFYTDLHLLEMQSTLALLALGIFQLGLAYVFFSKGIKLTSPTNSSLLSLVEVLLNPIWVFLLIKELPTINALFGGGIILIAIIYNILLDYKRIDV